MRGRNGGIARLAGIMAGALLLAYAVAFPAPVQAQSTDPVWSTMMTVGNPTGNSRGYNTNGDGHGSLGSLDVSEFTVQDIGTTYTVHSLTVDTNHFGGAYFEVIPTLFTDRIDVYILEIAGVELPLDSANDYDGGTRFWV